MSEISPERLLISLFIQSSLQYPANIAGQGLWLTLLFRQEQAEGRIGKGISLYRLGRVLEGEAKDDILEFITRAAHRAHRNLAEMPNISPQKAEQIVREVLRASCWCHSFADNQLHALLEMLQIYMQAKEYVSGNEEIDRQNPELLSSTTRIKTAVCQVFDGEKQEHILKHVDKVLFTSMPSLHNYADERFRIFLMFISLPPRAGT